MTSSGGLQHTICHENRIESGELMEDPVGQGEELQLIYEAKGLSGNEAKRVVEQVLKDKEATLEALAREELGIDPTELGGGEGAANGNRARIF